MKRYSKAIGAGVGGGLAAAIVVVFVWILRLTADLDVPEEVQTAFASILTTVVAVVGAYVAPPNEDKAKEG